MQERCGIITANYASHVVEQQRLAPSTYTTHGNGVTICYEQWLCISVLLLLESSWRLSVRALFFRPVYACVREWLSVRSCARRILQRISGPASWSNRSSGGQGTRCWQSHRSKERMCCCLKYRLLQLQRSPSQGCVIVIFFFFAWCATLDVNWFVCIFSSWFLFAVNHICKTSHINTSCAGWRLSWP